MSDIDELHQLMSGPHEARDEALLDVLNALAASPTTHTPQPTPALAAFLSHPSPPHTTIGVGHQRAWTARLRQPRTTGWLRFVPAVLAGWLTPLLLGSATAVAATAATAALIAYTSHPSPPAVPAPTSPPVSTHPTPSRAATPARPLPTDPGGTSATATSTPHPTGVSTLTPKTHAGSSLIRAIPSRTTTGSTARPSSHTTQPTQHNGDDNSGTDQDDDQGDPDDQDSEAPQTTDPRDSDSATDETHDPDSEDHGNDTTTENPDQTGDQHDD